MKARVCKREDRVPPQIFLWVLPVEALHLLIPSADLPSLEEMNWVSSPSVPHWRYTLSSVVKSFILESIYAIGQSWQIRRGTRQESEPAATSAVAAEAVLKDYQLRRTIPTVCLSLFIPFFNIKDIIQSVKVPAIQAAYRVGREPSSATSLGDGQSGFLALPGKCLVFTYRNLSNFHSYSALPSSCPKNMASPGVSSSSLFFSYFLLFAKLTSSPKKNRCAQPEHATNADIDHQGAHKSVQQSSIWQQRALHVAIEQVHYGQHWKGTSFAPTPTNMLLNNEIKNRSKTFSTSWVAQRWSRYSETRLPRSSPITTERMPW